MSRMLLVAAAICAAIVGVRAAAADGGQPQPAFYDDNVAAESIASSSASDEVATGSYVLPKQIFNDGKPFYLEKNPLSGALDFNGKKTLGFQSPNAIVDADNGGTTAAGGDLATDLNSVHAPNFHDFLHLPVKYTSSKFVYPLVSSSYANLKYQGNNKNYVSNHKDVSATSTSSNSVPQRPHVYEVVNRPKTTTTMTTSTTTLGTTTTTTTTTERPTTTTTTTTPDSPTTTTAGAVQQQLLDGAPIITRPPQFTRPPLKYTTNKYKYSTIRKRPFDGNNGGSSLASATAGGQQYAVTPKYTPPPPGVRPLPPHAFRPLPGADFGAPAETTTTTTTSTTTTTTPAPERRPPPPSKDPNDMSLSDLFNSLLGGGGDDDEQDSLQMSTTTEEIDDVASSSTESIARPTPTTTTTTTPLPTTPTAAATEAAPQTRRPIVVHESAPEAIEVQTLHHSKQPAFGDNFHIVQPPQMSGSVDQQQQQPPQQHHDVSHNQVPPPTPAQPTPPHHFNPTSPQRPAPASPVAPNSNRIVIAPEQNSVSFVLGSQQSVGGSGGAPIAAVPPPPQQRPVMFSSETMEQQQHQHQQPGPFGMLYSPGQRPQGFAHVGVPPPQQQRPQPAHSSPPAASSPNHVVVVDDSAATTALIGVSPANSRPPPAGTGFRFPVAATADGAAPAHSFDNAPIVTGTFKAEPDMQLLMRQPDAGNGNSVLVFPPAARNRTADAQNLVVFGAGESGGGSSGTPVRFINVPAPTMNGGDDPDTIQVPMHVQMNYPVGSGGASNGGASVAVSSTGGGSSGSIKVVNSPLNQPPQQQGAVVVGTPQPQQPPQRPHFVHEPNQRPSYNRLHLTQQQKQQLHQHAQQQQQQFYQQHQQQQQQQSHRPPQPQMAAKNDQTPILVPPPQVNQPSSHQSPPPPRRPTSNATRPIIGDRLLPNILPQFRPNAKIGYSPAPNGGGHQYQQPPPPSFHTKEAAAAEYAQKMRGKPPPQQQQQLPQQPPPQFGNGNNLNRRIQPVQHRPLPPHLRRPLFAGGAKSNGAEPPLTAESDAASSADNNPNRRYFQVRPGASSSAPAFNNPNERIYNAPPSAQQQQHQQQQQLQHFQQLQPLRRFVDQYQQPAGAHHPQQQQQQSPRYQPLTMTVAQQQFADAHRELAAEQRRAPPTAVGDSVHIVETGDAASAASTAATAVRLEPVVTLQQLQHQKLLQKQAAAAVGDGSPSAPDASSTTSTDNRPPVYVVYPVRTAGTGEEADAEATTATDGPASSTPSAFGGGGGNAPTAAGNVPYQNTPFTVVRQAQQPILTVRPKQSGAAVAATASQSPTTFPYALERPDASFVEEPFADGAGKLSARVVNRPAVQPQSASGDDDAGDSDDYVIDPVAAAISSKLTRITERPIAIAYTPTEPPSAHHAGAYHRPTAAQLGPAYSQHGYRHPGDADGYFSHANHATAVIAEIRDDEAAAAAAATTATAAAHQRIVHTDTDEFGNPARGDNYRQEFEAPFYPSVNADVGKQPSEAVRNSWAVVTPPPSPSSSSSTSQTKTPSSDAQQSQSGSEERGTIDRSDVNASDSKQSSTAAAPPSNFSQFEPELQGGFRPIYPPGMLRPTDDSDSDDLAAATQPRKVVVVQQQQQEPPKPAAAAAPTTPPPPPPASVTEPADEHGTEDESIAALVYDGLGATFAQLLDDVAAESAGESAASAASSS